VIGGSTVVLDGGGVVVVVVGGLVVVVGGAVVVTVVGVGLGGCATVRVIWVPSSTLAPGLMLCLRTESSVSELSA
jgi:hypothetical protein